jgi:hypothetical protein
MDGVNLRYIVRTYVSQYIPLYNYYMLINFFKNKYDISSTNKEYELKDSKYRKE